MAKIIITNLLENESSLKEVIEIPESLQRKVQGGIAEDDISQAIENAIDRIQESLDFAQDFLEDFFS